MRRAAELSQSDVAAGVGVATSSVAGWEADNPTTPDPEKLPALARVLGRDLDDLFPRTGLPDLADLRCDAGLYQYETSAILGTKSAGPVRGAERGERRLKERYVSPLAAAYGVSEEELLRAQERSIAKTQELPDAGQSGESQADADRPPGSLSEKITLLLERSFPGQQQPPSDAEIAEAVNIHAGAEVTSEEDVRNLRTGQQEDAAPLVREGLAAFFGVSPMYFQPDDAVAQQVYEGLRLLSASRRGAVGRVRARGGNQGLPADVMSIVNDLVDELEQRDSRSK
ncbi:helix-turn-helix transcriptional regulator [Streptomyces yatensis]|uniref:helix-turn-helix transcriptional regulator n=1 Tax=Streptomyces yatensis TaxID=155177 RepID=UPI001FEBFCD2|nr:helix-turn-helix transcriptional regulator [Streptomyces yatensis]